MRLSQVGFGIDEIKTSIVLSTTELKGETFYIVNSKNKKTLFNNTIGESKGAYGKFKYSYVLDFSDFREEGSFKIVVKYARSYKFSIGDKLFQPVVKELMRFFPIQRCGYTNPSEHAICHIADATSLIDGNKTVNKKIDVTGGWHDAGDYIKFLNTTALTTYTLLFAYDFDKSKFGFDFDGNNIPDILEEAKIGLDWMLRAQTEDGRFITQVQTLQDHDVGWRMPENDSLTFNRPAYIGIGKNLIGIYSATLALASRIWGEKFHHTEFSKECIETAKKYYAKLENVPDIDSSGSGQYIDKTFEGKLALGAIELYNATGMHKYLSDAKKYATNIGAEYWWSFGEVANFAFYKIAKYTPSYIAMMNQSLTFFNSKRNSNLFGETVFLGWGSNYTQAGTAVQAIFYKKLTNSTKYDSLIISVRDYLLGKNPWGISFASNIGTNYSRHLHHQISFLKHMTLPGGFAAGPVSKKTLESYKIPFERKDRYKKFQTDATYYRDDRMDYVTNEPTIIGNAIAVLLFGYFID